MWLVKRNTLQKVRPISFEIKTSLARYFIENKKITFEQKQGALKLLQEAHENGYWLACDCLINAAEPPLMYVRRLETGQLSLVRMPNRQAHLTSCAFKFIENSTNSSSEATNPIKSWDKSTVLNLHHSLKTTLATSSKTEKTGKASTAENRLPRLGRLLYSLLQDAGLTKIAAVQPTITEQFNNIKNQAKHYLLAHNINMADFLWTFPTQAGFAAVQLKKSKPQWPDNLRPYGIFILYVEKFEGNTAFCLSSGKKVSFELQGNLTFSSGRLSVGSGPFLLISTMTDSPAKPGMYVPMNGFAVPIYANYLLAPIESHYERRVLQKLIQLTHIFQKKGIPLIIEKPLFDISIKEADKIHACRPDFLLKTPNKTIVLEVMGSDEEQYHERKARTHLIMQKLGIFISFNALEADKNNLWQEHLDNLCKKIYAIIM